MKKNLLLLAYISVILLAACSTSSDETENTLNLSGRTFKETKTLPFANNYNMDGKELENFKRCVKISNFLTNKYTESETTKDSIIKFITSLTEEVQLSFNDKDNCTLEKFTLRRFIPKNSSVYSYECKLPNSPYTVSTPSGRGESLSSYMFTYNENKFRLVDYTYRKEVFTEKETLGGKEEMLERKKSLLKYTIDTNGHIKFIDTQTKQEYNGTLENNIIYANFTEAEGKQNILR